MLAVRREHPAFARREDLVAEERERGDIAVAAHVRAAHAGHQAGLELLCVPAAIGARAGFEGLRLDDDLGVVIPDRLLDPAHQDAMRRVLLVDDDPALLSALEFMDVVEGFMA